MLFYIFYYREIILKSWLKKVRLKRSEPKNTKKCFENEMSADSLKISDMERPRKGRCPSFPSTVGDSAVDTKQDWLGLGAVPSIYISNLPLAAVTMATRPPSNKAAVC